MHTALLRSLGVRENYHKYLNVELSFLTTAFVLRIHNKRYCRPALPDVWLKVRPHYAARQNATHYSFAARQKLLGICRQCDRVHMKKKILADLLQVTKTVERDRRTWSDFFPKLADTILKPLTHQMPCGFFWWDWQFADQIFRPRSLAALCRCVPHGIMWTYLNSAFVVIVRHLQRNSEKKIFQQLFITFHSDSYSIPIFIVQKKRSNN